MKKQNILYLLKMGMDDDNISQDIKNHRVRVIENINIFYKGVKYNMFFEFSHGIHRRYMTTNKRTGKPLKKEVEEIIIRDGLYIDTEFEKTEINNDGREYQISQRKLDLENEFYKEHHAYTKKDIIEVVNRYKIGEKFTDIYLIETV